MPKLRATATEKSNRKTQAMIDYGMTKEDVSFVELGKALCCDPRTVRHKRQYPETFTLRDIRALVNKFNYTDAQIIDLLGVRQ